MPGITQLNPMDQVPQFTPSSGEGQNFSQQPVNQPQAPVEGPKTNLKRLYFIIAIAVVLVTGVFVWYYWLRVIPGNEQLPLLNYFHRNTTAGCAKERESIGAVYPGVVPKTCCAGLAPVIPQGIVGTMGICQKVSDPTADWKTYANTQYGFETKYPSSWYIYNQNPADIFIQPDKEIPGDIPGPHASAFEIKITAISQNSSLIDAFMNDFRKNGSSNLIDSSRQESLKIDNVEALKITTTCEGLGCGAPEWYVIKNNYLYIFYSNLGYNEIFDQILSTFKFTN